MPKDAATTETPAPPPVPVAAGTTFPTSQAIEVLQNQGRILAGVIKSEGLSPFVFVPDGTHLEFIPRKEFADLPDHIRQTVELNDADSFVAYVKKFRTNTAHIFANAPDIDEVKAGGSGSATFTAILDYHQGGDEKLAGRSKHVVSYPVPLSVEFQTWMEKNGVPQSQMQFVDFIEENCPDVVTPSSAELQELALNFESRSEVQFQSKIDRTQGGKDLKFVEKVEGGSAGNMKVPEFLQLRMPVFDGGKPYMLAARMEYRVNGGRLQITYHLQRPHQVFAQAHKELKAEISTALELEILTGAVSPLPDDTV